MTKPLTLLLFEKLLPGSQLLNRLEDLGYRVISLSEPGALVGMAEKEKPLLVLVDVEPHHQVLCNVIGDLRRHPATSHIPVIAIASSQHPDAERSAREAGATLVVADNAILVHLNQFLNQALEL